MSTRPVDELIGQIDDELYMRGLRLEVIRPEVEQRNTPWMDRLIRDFHDIAVDSFGRSLPYEAIDGRTREADVLTVLRGGDGEALAYTVNARLELGGVPVNYFATALARRRMQGKGFYRLINPLREALIPDAQAVMTRTQNPLVDHSFAKVCAQGGYVLYPEPDMSGDAFPLHAVDMSGRALTIARAFAAGVEPSLICKGVYDFGEPCGPRALMYDTPAPVTDRQKRIWSQMDVERGDAVILVGIRQQGVIILDPEGWMHGPPR
ncbi:MAG TPA: hypothetical protein VJH22_01935 [Candidatus Nanoarchaeia archaeon]|nr:hypothetical protein [Candidatus Nanoarchaeia archaeon]